LSTLINEVCRLPDYDPDNEKWAYQSTIEQNYRLFQAIREIIGANLPLCNRSNLFCQYCFHRRTKQVIISAHVSHLFNIQRKLSVPICSTCHSSLNLNPEINTVVGVIGGDMGEFRQEKNTVRIPIWNQDIARHTWGGRIFLLFYQSIFITSEMPNCKSQPLQCGFRSVDKNSACPCRVNNRNEVTRRDLRPIVFAYLTTGSYWWYPVIDVIPMG